MSTYIRTATVLVRVNTDPPTWRRPRLSLSLSGRAPVLSFGWLRFAVQITAATASVTAKDTAGE